MLPIELVEVLGVIVDNTIVLILNLLETCHFPETLL